MSPGNGFFMSVQFFFPFLGGPLICNTLPPRLDQVPSKLTGTSAIVFSLLSYSLIFRNASFLASALFLASFSRMTSVWASKRASSRCATNADCRLADLQTCRPADLQTCRLADLQTCRLADLQTCRLADLQTCRLADL